MKKNNLLYRLLFVLSLAVTAVGCSDDDEKASAGFAGIGSSYYEEEGEVTITIPFVNGTVSESDLEFGGSATKDEDYEVVGMTDAGLQIKLLDDNDCEDIEKVRITITNASSGVNNMHTVTIFSDFNETTTAELEGIYKLTADGWQDYPLGTELEVQRVDDTHIRVVGYPATAFNHADMVLTITDFRNGVVDVASQASGSYNSSGTQNTTTSGSGTLSGCTGVIDLSLTFRFPAGVVGSNLHFVLERVEE